MLSCYPHQPESHQLSLHKVVQWERTGPIDRTPGTPGSNKNGITDACSTTDCCPLLSIVDNMSHMLSQTSPSHLVILLQRSKHYITHSPQYFFHLRAITLIQLIVWDLKYVFHWKQWSELRNVDTFTRSKPFTRRKARRHCVTGAVLTHDAMNTGFYFWKPTTSALYKKVG